MTVNDSHPDHPITIGGNLSAECRAELIRVLRKHVDAFTWVLTDMTGIPRFVAEHELKTYPHIEPRVQRKKSIALDRRKVVKEEVEEWLKPGIVKRVWYLTWVRLVDTIFEGQIGRNLEAYVDDMVIKSKTESDLIENIEETLLTLKKVNMKLNPKNAPLEWKKENSWGT
ncbi:hypothetical protein Tco_0058607 [Tanacetum coccineum]